MATIKLKTPPARKTSDPRADRAPVRGASAARKRPTLSEAQDARAEREARYQDQLRQRYGDAPPESARRGPEPARGDAPRRSAPRPDPRAAPRGQAGRSDPRGTPPGRDRNDAFDPARRGPATAQRDAREARSPRRDDSPPSRTSAGPNAGRGAPLAEQRDDGRASPPRRGTNNAGRDTRPPARDTRPPARGARDDARPAPYRGTQDDGRAARPPAPYQGPRDDGRAFKPKTDAFGSRGGSPPPASPAPRSGPQPSARAGATARRNAAAWQNDDRDDDDRDERPVIPGSMRLSKRMSELGIASRREADEWIPKGWVRVDGRVVSELGSRVTPDQQITIDAKAKFVQAQKVTVLINKPIGYVSGQAEDGYEPASVLVVPDNHWHDDQSGIRFLKEHLRFLAPAGRLDIDSTGLLVLTQDGRIAKQLIGEDRETEKEYLVRVQSENGRRVPDAALQKLRHGLELDGEALLPAQVEWLNDDQLRFVLKEGKKRQIRRMCELVGLKVVGLKRVRIGKVMLGDLPLGAWRYLRLDEGFI